MEFCEISRKFCCFTAKRQKMTKKIRLMLSNCKFLIAQWHRLQRPHSVKIRASGPISAGPSLGPQQNHNKISANKSYDPIALLLERMRKLRFS